MGTSWGESQDVKGELGKTGGGGLEGWLFCPQRKNQAPVD